MSKDQIISFERQNVTKRYISQNDVIRRTTYRHNSNFTFLNSNFKEIQLNLNVLANTIEVQRMKYSTKT